MSREFILLLALVVATLTLAVPGTRAYTPPFIFRESLRHGQAYQESVRLHEVHRHLHGFAMQNTTVSHYEQLISHTDPSLGTFLQRFWMDLSNNMQPNDIAFLYINGEAPGSAMDGYAAMLAQEFNAMTFALEHRFYGESMPFPLTNRAGLQHLTIENALADLVSFMDFIEEKVVNRRLRWVSVGGSYAGALSAWLKESYPDRLVAAWSSSGVVEAKLDFSAYDGHIASVLPSDCLAKTKTVMKQWEILYDNPATWADLLELFGTPKYFRKSEMAFAVVDGIAGAVQYGRKTRWCEAVANTEDPDELVRILAKFSHDMWGADSCASCSDSTYCMTNTTMADQWGPSGYSWVYQTCSRLAYFQIAYPDSIRPQVITTDSIVQQCRDVFGNDTFPDVFSFNKKYGGLNITAQNVIALQGSDDPWSEVGVCTSKSDTYVAFMAECDDCGHCGDLGYPSPEDPPNLTKQREFIRQTLRSWLHIPDKNTRTA